MNKNNLTLEQQQQLQDLGVNLRQIREKRRLSLDTIARQTLISQRLLKAIEDGDFAELPEPFYVRALIRKYALAVHAPEIDFVVDPQPEVTTENKPQRPQYWANFQLRSRHLYLLYILLVIASVRGITSLVERPVVVNQIPVPNSPILVPQQQFENTAQINQSKTSPQFISRSNSSDTVSVGIDLQERCWLKVMVDGEIAFEGILPQGTQRQWSGKKEVTIRAGNAGGVVVNFNNQQQKILGAPGQVEEITYTVN